MTPPLIDITLIWKITLILVIPSLFIFIILSARRCFEEKKNGKYCTLKQEIKKLLLRYLANPSQTKDIEILKEENSMPIVADAAEEILRTLKGTSQKLLINLLKNIDFEQWIQQSLHHKDEKRRIAAISLAPDFPNNQIKHRL
ncbi:MAG: hypothetical protein O3B09_04535, partial [Proteobacteria bacterium]|nr:hypothetical protein [Pseudomonadota bacterium]